MPTRRKALGRLWALLLLCLPLSAAGSAAERLDAFLSGLDTLRADFVQTVTNAEGSARLEGTFYLRRPDRFRWEYSAPEPQSIVADGRNIWLYDPELEQVSVQLQSSALAGTPAMLLVERGSSAKSFVVVELQGAAGETWYELTPREEESQYEQIRLGLENGQLSRLEMRDKLGQIIGFRFRAVRTGIELDDGLFVFEPPSKADLYVQ